VRTAGTFRAHDRWPAAVALVGFALVAVAARARPSRSGVQQRMGISSGSPVRVTARPQRERVHGSPPRHRWPRVPWWLIQLLIEATLLVAVIAAVVFVVPRLSTFWRDRRVARLDQPAEPAPDELARQVSRTLRETGWQLAQGHIRDGVILCWRRLEEHAEVAGFARLATDTSTDLADRLLASLSLSPAPLNRLAALYREARFSSHPISAEAVAQARADLARLSAELDGAAVPAGAEHGPAGAQPGPAGARHG